MEKKGRKGEMGKGRVGGRKRFKMGEERKNSRFHGSILTCQWYALKWEHWKTSVHGCCQHDFAFPCQTVDLKILHSPQISPMEYWAPSTRSLETISNYIQPWQSASKKTKPKGHFCREQMILEPDFSLIQAGRTEKTMAVRLERRSPQSWPPRVSLSMWSWTTETELVLVMLFAKTILTEKVL